MRKIYQRMHTFTSVHSSGVMLLVSVFTSTLGMPRGRIKISPSLKPELANFFWS